MVENYAVETANAGRSGTSIKHAEYNGELSAECGADLTKFDSLDSFNKFVDKFDLEYDGEVEVMEDYHVNVWSNEWYIMVTGYHPDNGNEPGYVGRIGFSGDSVLVKEALEYISNEEWTKEVDYESRQFI